MFIFIQIMPKAKPLTGPLKFTCTKCGTCCIMPDDTTVYASETEYKKIARHLKISLKQFLKKYTTADEGYIVLRSGRHGSCILYDKGCSIYPTRPIQCRTFPFWFINLKSKNAWKKAAKTCPGMDTGRLWNVKEIQKKRDDFSWNLLRSMRA